MKTKIVLGEHLPDFKSKVPLTLVNGDESEMTFTFRHLSQSDITEAIEKLQAEVTASGDQVAIDAAFTNKMNAKVIMILASGWELENEFNESNVATLFDYHPNFYHQIMKHYHSARAGDRVKN